MFTANSGFVLTDTVEVVGAAYTWDYATGTLVLSNPTADIAISVIATKSGYTNIIDTVGYTDNMRLSTSDGVTEKEADGYTLTGAFLLPEGATMRTKGVNFNTATYSTARMYGYNADTNEFYTAYGIGEGETSTFPLNQVDNEGNAIVTRGIGSGDILLRLCGYGLGENLIVTIDEEITE